MSRSTCSAIARGEGALRAPRARNAPTSSSFRSRTVSRAPCRSRLPASLPPTLPRPINPIRMPFTPYLIDDWDFLLSSTSGRRGSVHSRACVYGGEARAGPSKKSILICLKGMNLGARRGRARLPDHGRTFQAISAPTAERVLSMSQASQTLPTGTVAPAPSMAVRWYVLILMCAVYTLSITDRYMVTQVLEPIRLELHLTAGGVGGADRPLARTRSTSRWAFRSPG